MSIMEAIDELLEAPVDQLTEELERHEQRVSLLKLVIRTLQKCEYPGDRARRELASLIAGGVAKEPPPF